MSSFAEKFENAFRRLLPSPLAIALLLTIIAFALALFTAPINASNTGGKALFLIDVWKDGLWQSSLLAFTVQMMLILVLGHTLALSKPVTSFISLLTSRINNGTQAAVLVAVCTMLVALFNWGLGLIFGAVFARKVAEAAHKNNTPISYPLIGAAGYSGLMVWHGGLSGSAPLKANEAGHIAELVQGKFPVPSQIPLAETVFSSMNIIASILVISTVAITVWLLSKRIPTKVPAGFTSNVQVNAETEKAIGAEKLDQRKTMGSSWGILIVVIAVVTLIQATNFTSELTPNFINFALLGLALLAHGSLNNFSNALDEAIKGSSGILIQFPLYFGIMAIVRDSGLVSVFAETMIATSNETTFPILTMLSAGIVNIFVPSGGGQWAIQGPILIEASQSLNISLGKSVMAMAYGDQLTNMLQPFWALPLLGITKLKAREILPYTLILMGVGTLSYGLCLFLF